jgi:hypothetical protein
MLNSVSWRRRLSHWIRMVWKVEHAAARSAFYVRSARQPSGVQVDRSVMLNHGRNIAKRRQLQNADADSSAMLLKPVHVVRRVSVV